MKKKAILKVFINFYKYRPIVVATYSSQYIDSVYPKTLKLSQSKYKEHHVCEINRS